MKRKKIITTLVIGIVIIIIVSFVHRLDEPLKSTSLEEYEEFREEFTHEHYVIFGSDNCISCNKMGEVYSKAFHDAKNVLYVDLSKESVNDKRLQKYGLNAIPVVIHYDEKKAEVGRVEGTTTYERLIAFINE